MYIYVNRQTGSAKIVNRYGINIINSVVNTGIGGNDAVKLYSEYGLVRKGNYSKMPNSEFYKAELEFAVKRPNKTPSLNASAISRALKPLAGRGVSRVLQHGSGVMVLGSDPRGASEAIRRAYAKSNTPPYVSAQGGRFVFLEALQKGN